MEDKHNAAAVGAFVLLLGAALVGLVLWLAVGLNGRKEVRPYRAVLAESVAGLSVDAPVKFLGVDVGKVKSIAIDPTNSRLVVLNMQIERGTPIKTDSEAVLTTQGLTGIAYIEISGGTPGAPLLLAGADEQAPTILSKPSVSARLELVLTRVLASVDRMSNNLGGLFDAGTRAALKSALADTATVAHALAAQEGSIRSGLQDAARTAKLAAQAAERLQPTLARIDAAAQGVQSLSVTADRASARVALAADVAASGVQQVRAETLPEISRLIVELDELAGTVRRLGEQTGRNPAGLLVGTPARAPGPGEESPR